MKKLISVSGNRQASLRTRLALGTALATIAFGYGGRGAYAGVCSVTVSPSFLCSGPVGPDVTQNLSAAGLSVTTSDDFAHTVGSYNSDALSLTSTGGLTFNDTGLGGSAISAFRRGINANNAVSGDVNVTTNGAISLTGFGGGNDKAGIFVTNDGGGNATVTSNNTITTTTGNGINVSQAVFAGGSITINANDTISAGNYRGIVARAYSATSNITITAGSVSGSSRGIEVYSGFAAATTTDITVSGAVTGGSYGIQANKGNIGTNNITLNSGANVSGGGDAILASGGGSTTNNLTVNSGATITGSVRMFGNDNVIFNGGDISGVTTINAYSGTDSITFTNTGGAQAVSGSQIVNFENFTVGTGGNVSLSGALNVTTVTAENGGILGGTGTINANVGVTDGTLSAGNSPGLLSIVGNLDLGVSSTTLVELGGVVAGTQYDVVDVSAGTATLVAGATFTVDFVNFFTAGLGDSFDVLVADSIVGDVNTLNFDFTNALLAFGLEWGTAIVNDGMRDVLRLTVQEGENIALPVPSGIALLGAGLLGLIGLRRRRRDS